MAARKARRGSRAVAPRNAAAGGGATARAYAAATPPTAAAADTDPVSLGVEFYVTADSNVTAIHFWQPTTGASAASRTVGIYAAVAGTPVGVTQTLPVSGTGWQTATLVAPIAITAYVRYRAVVYHPAGGYAADSAWFSTGTGGTSLTVGPLAVPSNAAATGNKQGTFNYATGISFPNTTFGAANYWVDVTVVTTAAPAVGLNVALNPSAFGYPDATNTGVPPGTTLAQVPADVTSGTGWTWVSNFGGMLVTTANNAVIDSIEFFGPIDVLHDNCTIQRSKFTYTGQGNVINLKSTTAATVDQVTITVPPGTTGTGRLQVGIKDIYGDCQDTLVKRCDISGWCNGIQLQEGVIRDNYVHDAIFGAGDHTNSFTSNGSTSPMLIQHNTMFNQLDQTDAISLFQDFGLQSNHIVDDNIVAGGGYTIYGGGGGFGVATDIQITNNRFARIYFPNCGSYGPITAWDAAGTNNVWAGNVWDDTGLPVSV